MTLKEKKRQGIDAQLTASGWVVQTRDQIIFTAARGIAISDLCLTTRKPKFTPFVDSGVLGTIETFHKCRSILRVKEQSGKYVNSFPGFPGGMPAWHDLLLYFLLKLISANPPRARPSTEHFARSIS